MGIISGSAAKLGVLAHKPEFKPFQVPEQTPNRHSRPRF
jgi:hypothetical protein